MFTTEACKVFRTIPWNWGLSKGELFSIFFLVTMPCIHTMWFSLQINWRLFANWIIYLESRLSPFWDKLLPKESCRCIAFVFWINFPDSGSPLHTALIHSCIDLSLYLCTLTCHGVMLPPRVKTGILAYSSVYRICEQMHLKQHAFLNTVSHASDFYF